MGNTTSLNCCIDHNSQPNELISIAPSKIIIKEAYQDNINPFKHNICRTSFLSEMDYYLTRFKNHQKYLRKFQESVGSFQDVLDSINYEENQNWNVPIQTKTYNLNDNRFDTINNTVYPSQFGILILSKKYQNQSILSKSNLKKLQFLLLSKPFKTYQQSQYIQKLLLSFSQWQNMNNYTWILHPKTNYPDMSRQLLYHLPRYISFVNSQISINDIVSLVRVKYLLHYFYQIIALTHHQLLEKMYAYDNWVHQAEAQLFGVGQIITLHNFTQLRPYTEEQVYEDDAVRLNPPKGDEEITKIKIRVIVKPLKTTKTAVKFRFYQFLYYLPFTMFSIDKIEQKYGHIYLYVKQIQSQKIVDFLTTNTKPALSTKAKSQNNILNELSQFRTQFAKTLQQLNDKQLNKIHELSQLYYERYIKNRVNVIISQQELPVLSKRQLQICDDEVKLKIQQQKPQQQIDSQIQNINLSSQQTTTYQKQLDKYIKNNNNFQKLQNQIDTVDIFYHLTSLNISQSWLERLECLHCFPNLVQLFAYSNLIKKIQGLEHNYNLRVLSLARNDIAAVQNIDHLKRLRQLYLTKNKLELPSAGYLSSLPLAKLKVLAISFKNQADQCFEVLMRRPPPNLKKIVINEGGLLSNRAKNTLKRRLKGVQITYIHG